MHPTSADPAASNITIVTFCTTSVAATAVTGAITTAALSTATLATAVPAARPVHQHLFGPTYLRTGWVLRRRGSNF